VLIGIDTAANIYVCKQTYINTYTDIHIHTDWTYYIFTSVISSYAKSCIV